MKYYLNIGSNISDPRRMIALGVERLESLFGPCRVSSPIESEPWGFDSPNSFVNIGIEVETDLSPRELLTAIQTVERELSPVSHRNPDGSYKDREIDIDIMDYDGPPYSDEHLAIPHPHLSERPFFLIPLNELRK